MPPIFQEKRNAAKSDSSAATVDVNTLSSNAISANNQFNSLNLPAKSISEGNTDKSIPQLWGVHTSAEYADPRSTNSESKKPESHSKHDWKSTLGLRIHGAFKLVTGTLQAIGGAFLTIGSGFLGSVTGVATTAKGIDRASAGGAELIMGENFETITYSVVERMSGNKKIATAVDDILDFAAGVPAARGLAILQEMRAAESLASKAAAKAVERAAENVAIEVPFYDPSRATKAYRELEKDLARLEQARRNGFAIAGAETNTALGQADKLAQTQGGAALDNVRKTSIYADQVKFQLELVKSVEGGARFYLKAIIKTEAK